MKTYYEGVNGRLIPVKFHSLSTSGKIYLQVSKSKFGYFENELIETYPYHFVEKVNSVSSSAHNKVRTAQFKKD